MPVDIQVATAAENILADKSLRVGVADRLLHDHGKIPVLAANVDVPALCAHSQSADHDTLDHRVRIVLENQPVFARAGFALIAVAQNILRLGRLLGHERPLHPGREARPPAPTQPRTLDLINYGVWFHGERLLHGLIAVQFEIPVDIRRTQAEAPGDHLHLVGMRDQVSHRN